jgi:hypothetical protein
LPPERKLKKKKENKKERRDRAVKREDGSRGKSKPVLERPNKP